MPLYRYRCQHGHIEHGFAKIANRDDPRFCECGAFATRLFDAPAIRPDIQPYQSPVDGRWIDSRVARKEDLRRTGSVEWEPGLREQAERNRLESIESDLKVLDATVDKAVAEMKVCNFIEGD